MTSDHDNAPSQYPYKLVPLKPPPLRPSADSPGSPTVLGSVQRYQNVVHLDENPSNEGVNVNSNNPHIDYTSTAYSQPISLSDGTKLEALVTARDNFPLFSGLGNPDNNAQDIPPSDLSKSLPSSAFSTGRQHRPKNVSFNLGSADSDVLANSDGAVNLGGYG